MLISEIFHSIQGEGELTGVPTVFIRTSGCNLRCSWCDTKFASWNPEGEEFTPDEIVQAALRFPSRHCVLTGGEPMVAKEMPVLAEKLKREGFHITIETAGTIPPNGIPCDLASISPKLSNSVPTEGSIAEGWRDRHERTRLQPAILREWIKNYPFQLKFVVETATDLSEIQELLCKIEQPIPPSKVMLMPQGIDTPTIRGRSESLVDVCLRFGYRYCNRLHIDLFGNTRGT